jgi:hypothetical protein
MGGAQGAQDRPFLRVLCRVCRLCTLFREARGKPLYKNGGLYRVYRNALFYGYCIGCIGCIPCAGGTG